MIKKEKLGEGTYGLVYGARSPTTGTNYAIKRNLSENSISFHTGYRELDIMNTLRDHPNILRLDRILLGNPFSQGMLSPINKSKHRGQRDNNLHFVFPRGSYDLHDFAFNSNGLCTYRHLHKLMVDMLLGVEYIHGKGIMHRDLKPCNIIVFFDADNNKAVKGCVADFGFAKYHSFQECHTPSIITSWYRSPEMARGSVDYDFKADMWSIGCILFEIIAHRAFIYGSGDDDADILKHILRNIPEDIGVTKRPRRSQHIRRLTLREQINLPDHNVKLFETEMGSYDLFLDLLMNLFKYHPQERFTIHQTLDHPFFNAHREYITSVRRQCPLIPLPQEAMHLCACPERAWIGELVVTIFNGRNRLKWYRPRILFHALDMFDRYLHTVSTLCEVEDDGSHENGKWFIRDDIEWRFYVCLYLSFKYFTSLPQPISFAAMVPERFRTQHYQVQAEEFEFSFVYECLAYRIYRPTCFEAADHFGDRLSEIDIRNLLLVYSINPSLSGLTPVEFYDYYRSHLRQQPVQELIKPLAPHWRERKY